ncbi:unnamed protein product [Pleuronectes platessa]|uniref:Uncharacterized protein n=1 Tax=Pleuronectes platessa TaxID=8262 RepID=A0A9N7VLS7_PLEPL|nr:unnamed protein product [Pleuronectes platessa]
MLLFLNERKSMKQLHHLLEKLKPDEWRETSTTIMIRPGGVGSQRSVSGRLGFPEVAPGSAFLTKTSSTAADITARSRRS